MVRTLVLFAVALVAVFEAPPGNDCDGRACELVELPPPPPGNEEIAMELENPAGKLETAEEASAATVVERSAMRK